MRSAPVIVVVAIAAAAAALFWRLRVEAPPVAVAAAAQPQNTGLRDLFSPPSAHDHAIAAHVDAGHAHAHAGMAAASAAASPFGRGAQVETMTGATSGEVAFGAGQAPPPLSEADLKANEQLKKLGYLIDERYYKMSLAELRESAGRRDAQALTHLAERYLFELDGRPGPEHQPGFPYREAAREALRQAFQLGNAHAAAMVSESWLLERRPVEAAAWNLVARRAGDQLSADWFIRTEDYQQLSAAQRADAAQRAETLWRQLQKTGTS